MLAYNIVNYSPPSHTQTHPLITLLLWQLSSALFMGTLPPPHPQAIRRVLVSKACRGAVMFGDHLSRRQCQRVIHTLRECALPFQCAHGRPTLAPLLRLAPSSLASTASASVARAPSSTQAPSDSDSPAVAPGGGNTARATPRHGIVVKRKVAVLPPPDWPRWRAARRRHGE